MIFSKYCIQDELGVETGACGSVLIVGEIQ